LSRPSRLGKHRRASLIGIAGTSPAMATEKIVVQRSVFSVIPAKPVPAKAGSGNPYSQTYREPSGVWVPAGACARAGEAGRECFVIFSTLARRIGRPLRRVRAGARFQPCLGSTFCYTGSMKRSIPVKRKRIGRPPTGITPIVGLRLPPQVRAKIEQWAGQQDDKPTLSEATRRLIDAALIAAWKRKGKTR
jgi:hypothetical protein